MTINKFSNKKIKLFWIISLILTPLSLIAYLWLFAAYIAGGLFLTSVEFTNRTEMPIKISPYGLVSYNETTSLPSCFDAPPYLPKLKTTHFYLLPNESKIITYDTDDNLLNGVLIETERQIKDYKRERFEILDGEVIIKDIQFMPDADVILTNEIFKIKLFPFVSYFLLFVGLTNPFFLVMLNSKRKK
jgi:hypothetical protein